MEYFEKSGEEVLKELQTQKSGLQESEAKARLLKFGRNEIALKKRKSAFTIFLSQFESPLIWILIGAVIVSAFLKEFIDASVIAVILILNAIMGFVQEYKAENAILELRKLSVFRSKVLRDNTIQEIDSKDIVVGDILILEAGDKIPADCLLLSAEDLETQEANLTGESMPVQKKVGVLKSVTVLAERKNIVFSSTLVTKGTAKGVVYATAMQTEIGKIAHLIQTTEEELTPLQKKLKQLGIWLTVIILALIFVLFLAGLLRGFPLAEMFLSSVSLAVAVVPEGLPAIVTITLALGVKRMIKKNTLVRRLSSVETLGSCTVICTDKTGTLTENQMTVRKIFANNEIVDVTGSGYLPEGNFSKDPKSFRELLKIGFLCNNAKIKNTAVLGDPTEAALLVSFSKARFSEDELIRKFPKILEIPFTSERMSMTTIHSSLREFLVCTKGAPENVLRKCSFILIAGRERRMTEDDKQKVLQANSLFASQALRVLGFSYKKIRLANDKNAETGMVFAGLQAMMDPPREGVKEAIVKCYSAGIKVVMITGDQVLTAKAIAEELGIIGKAVAGEEITDAFLEKEVNAISIYARVSPEHKNKIITALQKKGHIVAMTGDGVNDAPALKKADIGIAMGRSGTEVAKEASDMILTDDHFSSIVNAIEEGRGIYNNIKKFFSFLLAGNIAELLIAAFAIIMGLPLPFTAAIILLINLVTDGLPALALGVDVYDPTSMKHRPRNPNEGIYQGTGLYLCVYPIIISLGTLYLFYDSLLSGAPLKEAQTIVLFTLVLFELFAVFATRSMQDPFFRMGFKKAGFIFISIFLSLAITLMVIYIPAFSFIFGTIPLTFKQIGISTFFAFGGFFLIELLKIFFLFLRRKQNV